MDRATQQAIEKLAKELARTDAKADQALRTKRAPQLGHSSIDQGAMEVRDPESQAVRARIGWLPDGTVGMVTEGGDPVSAPTAPIVTPSLGGLRVTWDGSLSNDLAIPGDFDHMAVHVSTSSGFEPGAGTFVGTIRRAGEGGMLPVVPLPYVEHFVVLVPVTTGGVQGAPSAEVSATPLQTSGVDLEADSVTAVHIQAGAVEADKLQAVLALVTTIVAGIPGAARVELDQDGMRGYNEANELIFAIDSAGNAIFSGEITGSEIRGSIIRVGDVTTVNRFGQFRDDTVAGKAVLLVGAGTGLPSAQLAASDTIAEMVLRSDIGDPDTKPSVQGWANTTSAQMVAAALGNTGPAASMVAAASASVLAVRANYEDSVAYPHSTVTAVADSVYHTTASPSGSKIEVGAYTDSAYIAVRGPDVEAYDPDYQPGYVLGDNNMAGLSGHTTNLKLRSPRFVAGYNVAELALSSALNTAGSGTWINAGRVIVGGAMTPSGFPDYDDLSQFVEIEASHSLSATRHRPQVSAMAVQPNGSTDDTWITFTGGVGAGTWAPIPFVAPTSGMVEVRISLYGNSNASGNSFLAVGFSLAGASSVPAARERACTLRSNGSASNGPMSAATSIWLDLEPNGEYLLSPAWRKSSGVWGTNTNLYTTDGTCSIAVIPHT